MRCVFDTSVLISALLLSDSTPRKALNLALRQGTLLLSFSVLAELDEVLGRRQFRRYVDEETVRAFLAGLIGEAEWVEVEARLAVCRDPRDDKILELAASGEATCVVSGDQDLLVLDPFRGIRILSPQAFLEWSAAESDC